MTIPGINLHLAAAIRHVNAEFRRLPDDRARPALAESWARLEADLERYHATGDRDSAMAAVERWEAESLRALGVGVTT